MLILNSRDAPGIRVLSRSEVWRAAELDLDRFAEGTEREAEVEIDGASARVVRGICREIVARKGLPVSVEGYFGRVLLRRMTGRHTCGSPERGESDVW